MIYPQLSEYEIEVLRYIAEEWNNSKRIVRRRDFPRYEQLENKVDRVVVRFCGFKFLEGGPPSTAHKKDICFRIMGEKIDRYLHDLDNPPRKNWPKEVKERFFSSRLSLLVCIPLVVVSVLYTFVKAFAAVCHWMGWMD